MKQEEAGAKNAENAEREEDKIEDSPSMSSMRSLRLDFFSSDGEIAAKNAEREEDQIEDSPSMSSMHSLRQNSSLSIVELCEIVRQTAYEVHVYLGNGYLEKVYENALVHRLQKRGLEVEQQYSLPVYDEDGTMLGNYYADILVNQTLVVELKSARAIAPEHIAQLLHYLKTSRCEHGLLINFGSYRFEIRKLAFARSLERAGLRDTAEISSLDSGSTCKGSLHVPGVGQTSTRGGE